MRKKLFVIAGPPMLGLAILFFKETLTKIILKLSSCPIYVTTGIYCPGCGNSRSLRALMHGHVLLSLRNNITIPILALLLLLLYIEYVSSAFGKNIRLLPRKPAFWICFGIFMADYYIIRNFIPQIAPV